MADKPGEIRGESGQAKPKTLGPAATAPGRRGDSRDGKCPESPPQGGLAFPSEFRGDFSQARRRPHAAQCPERRREEKTDKFYGPLQEFPAGAVLALKLKKTDLFICRRDTLTDKIGVTLARRHELRVV